MKRIFYILTILGVTLSHPALHASASDQTQIVYQWLDQAIDDFEESLHDESNKKNTLLNELPYNIHTHVLGLEVEVGAGIEIIDVGMAKSIDLHIKAGRSE